ncbi:amino acid adenylation domain-containing protein [Streptomyces sp. CB01881]|uniref:non-ribosomal peptide synthetase family protein n=1 Tax=Streptomyces sp. CB01881 TaxID=2078691 RepID=UPI000CDCB9C4|nr:amino acid adenylation domain-containing protein [Streptomyces sp. CB01881]AUY50156.1 amino acid adenylation protein [Streptomyces sp. CB01881]TYC73548.1 amino acid adenylation domain-containing protein [Streptomyces sp. CB01881]
MKTTRSVPTVPHARSASVGTSLVGLLEQQVHARPEAVAVVDGERSLTNRELSVEAGRLAARLHRLGAGADDCVGLCVEPSVDLMVGAWGILHAGAGYLPLSPDYPEDRLRYMIEDSRTRVIVTQGHLRDRLAGLAPPGTRIVTASEAPADGAQAPPAGPRPEALAYVIYTSGSTGRPKGVMIEHRSVVSQLRWMHATGHLGAGVAVLQKTPMSFDAAQWEILAPAAGARVVMGAPGVYRDPEALIATVRRHGVTALQCVPTLLQALLDTEGFAECTSLTRVFSGGEALSQRLARSFSGRLPWASLVNLYGPTECTINATAHVVDPETIGDGAGTVPIGRPVDNTHCFILDGDLAPVGVGTTGELYIGGVQLARGYLHRPELTVERFIPSPFIPTERLYRTGDLTYWNEDGTIQFAGRADNQVKLRGHRVELDEIAVAIEEHTWVRRAAAVVTDDERTGHQSLVACVELNPREAALMDQGNHGRHHQSKASRLQVKAQLSDPGLREAGELRGRPVVELPGKRESGLQRRETYARKTYRFYEGGPVTRDDLRRLLAPRPASTYARRLDRLTFPELGRILRWFGQFHSEERLLPKYAYASPGALYATQLYLETGGLDGLDAGLYYYHPVDHALVRIGPAGERAEAYLSVHFSGKRRAIEPVYSNNIQEVLEFEAGHMLGVFEEVLPAYGLAIHPLGLDTSVKDRLDVAEEDHYLGTFAIRGGGAAPRPDTVELFVQAHPGRVDGLPAGQYRYVKGELVHVSDELVQSRHVIAINQGAYERAAFGITAVSRADRPWLEYIDLGTTLHHLQRNGLALGFMSSGYSSRTGHPLPAARRIDAILDACGTATGPSYFFVGGKVSEEQIRSEGMREDAVHMKGPAEIIKDELATFLPDYMLPNRVLVLDSLPLTANGKVDTKALAGSEAVARVGGRSAYVAPATHYERWLAQAWGRALKYENASPARSVVGSSGGAAGSPARGAAEGSAVVSVEDEFFAAGGNSLIAVALVNRINREFGTRLPLQVVFERPKLADLAARIEGAVKGARAGGDGAGGPSSRLVPLHPGSADRPVFCWPGLGGYPMNLRLLGREAGDGRAFYGIQAHGINAGEEPYPTIREMAAADVAEIRRVQPEGPYTLWGYSFGARVAFEAAWQLESAGEKVTEVLLICPANPKVRQADGRRYGREASYRNSAYLTILFSVFAGAVGSPELERCLAEVEDEDGFVAFVHRLLPELDEEMIRRITRIVGETYEFEYTFRELAERRLDAPVTVFKASGDDYSFIDGQTGWSARPPAVVELAGDHYGVLKEHGIGELVAAIRNR